MKKITVVGSLNSDITVYIPRFPALGESLVGDRVGFGCGGKGGNQAIAAHRQGGEVVFISRVGDDALGRGALDFYRAEGISVEHIGVSRTAATGCGVIEVSAETGDNKIIVIKGANDELSAADVRAAEADFADCDLFLTQLETGMDSVLEGKRLAQRYGKPIVFNPAPCGPLPEGFLEGIDFVTPNETETEYYTGVAVTDEASACAASKKLLEMGARGVIITMGKRGAYLMDGDGGRLIPTTDLRAVDPTGAGDTFNGAFSVALAEGLDVETAIKFANCASSISVTRPGAAVSIPTRAETEALLASWYGVSL